MCSPFQCSMNMYCLRTKHWRVVNWLRQAKARERERERWTKTEYYSVLIFLVRDTCALHGVNRTMHNVYNMLILIVQCLWLNQINLCQLISEYSLFKSWYISRSLSLCPVTWIEIPSQLVVWYIFKTHTHTHKQTSCSTEPDHITVMHMDRMFS